MALITYFNTITHP